MAVALIASYLLHWFLGLTCLGCFIVVVIKQLRVDGWGRGLLGLFCGVYAFYWALLHAEEHGLRTVTRLWSWCILLAFANLVVWNGLRALS